MTSFNRNRLIGGVALVLTGFVFLPAVLSPPDNPNHGLTVKMEKSSELLISSSELVDEQSIQLESVNNSSQSIAGLSQSNAVSTTLTDSAAKGQVMVPIKLESLDVASTSVNANKPKAVSMPNVSSKQRWLQIGSFSDLANAEKLAKELQQKKYSVTVENTSVKGKPYRRVLIGPFNSDQDMHKTLKRAERDGYSLNIKNK
ncbi:MAG: SPOR domain-containing protein [Gammaproteobacteria bacterium]|nr:SPOR domain-containing protein [Gammaproteobacteria bacterium]